MLLAKVNQFVDYLNEETNDEIEQYIDRTYFYIMRISGIYPYLTQRTLLLTVFQLSAFLGILIFHMYDLLRNSIYFMEISLVLFSQEVHFALLAVVAFLIIVMNASHRRDFARIHGFMLKEYFDYEEGESDYMAQLKLEMAREKVRLILIPLFASVNGALVMLISRYVDSNFGTFDAAKYDINFLLPFPSMNSQLFDSSQGYGFLLVAGGQFACITIMLPMAITGAGFVLVSVLLDYIRQLKFLLHKIETAEERAIRLYLEIYKVRPTESGEALYQNVNFQKCYQISINKCIQHHSIILSVFDNIVGFMGFNFFQCFLVGSIIIALSANCVKYDSVLPGTVIANLSLCLNEIAYMYILSIFGQRISDLSDEIRYKFYGLRWYHCSTDFKKGLLIVQEQAARTLTIMGAKILPVNLNTFSSVMNSAYTYYNLLNAF